MRYPSKRGCRTSGSGFRPLRTVSTPGSSIRCLLPAGTKYAVTRSQEPRIDKALVEAEAKVTDMGVVTLGRLSGEGVDRKEEGYFTLTDNEKELLGAVCSAYHALGKKWLSYSISEG